MRLRPLLLILLPLLASVSGNINAKRLFDDLLTKYNKLTRPGDANKPLSIKIRLRLSQLIDVHEIDQILTCSVWLKQVWVDKKLSWEPKNYGGVSILYIPYEMIWVPDLVLYNNADSNYNITIGTKATLHYSGEVTWEPPAIFKSTCPIDVRWFPFDEQKCHLKFGSWTYSENLINLEMETQDVVYRQEVDSRGNLENVTVAKNGIDLSDYYPSVEWDIMSREAVRRARNYPSCCPENNYVDITYYLELRRKPLFYTVNLVFPCIGITFLTLCVFYLPSQSGEKIQMCIQIVVALTFFYILLLDIIPATSITLPLIGKYMLFTLVMATASVFITVFVLNLHFRKSSTHVMSPFIRKVFLERLPKILFMARPDNRPSSIDAPVNATKELISVNYHSRKVGREQNYRTLTAQEQRVKQLYSSPNVVKAFHNICFIAECLKRRDHEAKISGDWNFVAVVVDRLFLIPFTLACIFGTIIILLQAPTLYDGRQAVDLQYRPPNITIGIFP
uniref:Acetylcholine receptor subunit alpha-type unc-38 n=1 Tax=Steinernema glaseri TaxID=37863 RepID=A0A1I8AQF9_9BILA